MVKENHQIRSNRGCLDVSESKVRLIYSKCKADSRSQQWVIRPVRTRNHLNHPLFLDNIVNGVMGDNWLGGESGSLKKKTLICRLFPQVKFFSNKNSQTVLNISDFSIFMCEYKLAFVKRAWQTIFMFKGLSISYMVRYMYMYISFSFGANETVNCSQLCNSYHTKNSFRFLM